MMYVGEAFLRKGLPHVSSQILFVKGMEECLCKSLRHGKYNASLRDGSKEPAGTRARNMALLRADMESASTKNGKTGGSNAICRKWHRASPTVRQSISLRRQRNFMPQISFAEKTNLPCRRNRQRRCFYLFFIGSF